MTGHEEGPGRDLPHVEAASGDQAGRRPPVDSRLQRSQRRNARRVREADWSDRKTIGEFFPSEMSALFPCRLVGPDDSGTVPPRWVDAIRKVAATNCPTPAKSDLTFNAGRDARASNWALLARFDGDLSRMIESQRGTTVWHGSEFRPIDQLKEVVGDHPNFDHLARTFTHGMEYHFTRDLNEAERMGELTAQLARGNHQSAEEDPPHLSKLLAKDVSHGFAFAIDADKIPLIKDAMVQPAGLALQYGMKADGSRFPKKRLTHDLSFSITQKDSSVNSRVDMSSYPEMVYGWCLTRVIHFLVTLRASHPGQPIFLAKFDYSDAYRRVSHAGSAAAKTILVVSTVAYIMLRLSFGGSPNPPTFCEFSEMLTDLANELLRAKIEPSDIRSPTVREEHLSPVTTYGDDDAFASAIPPAVEVPIHQTAMVDCFVDDLVLAFLSTPGNLRRACHAVPLAVHVMSRPHGGDEEPVKRRQLLEPSKLVAEGRPTEVLVVLGWLLDTRRLLISLPEDKHRAWADDLSQIIKEGRTTLEALEQMIGRLNHAAYLIPLSRHFLNRLRWRIPSGRRRKDQKVRLNSLELDDLILWRDLLRLSRAGISMNLLTIRTPTRVGWSDSCPYGLGGYSVKGRAWRLKVPREASFYGDDSANNPLEFLGLAITALLLLHEAETDSEAFPCILSLSDSTSSIGWVFRSSKLGQDSRYVRAVTFIARRLAWEMTKGSAQLTAQHVKGSFNDVADLMSFHGTVRGYTNPLTEDSPSDEVLSNRIRLSYPQLVNEDFRISPLPPEILSFGCRALQIIEESWTPNKRKPGRTGTAAGEGGSTSSVDSGCMTPTWVQFPATGGDSSRNVSSSATGTESSTSRDAMLGSVRNQWWHRLSEMPLAMWQRRSGQMTAQVPSTTMEARPVRTVSGRK